MSDEILVPPEISAAKLQRELEGWRAHEREYRERGWILLRRDELVVEIAFAARVQASTSPAPLPVVTVCVRLDYRNYDLWPPSLTFIDLFTGQPIFPHVQAPLDGRLPDLRIDVHPKFQRPFLCVPGTREYHEHPQHDGDSWLLHRGQQRGSLTTICDLVWRAMARNILGVRVTSQTWPAPVQAQTFVQLWQGDVDAFRAQLGAAVDAAGFVLEVPPDAHG